MKQLLDRLVGPEDPASNEREDDHDTAGRREVDVVNGCLRMLGVPVHTLYRWRHNGDGPAGYRVGRHVRYRREAVEAWLEQQADKRS